jgi:pimeloyl-ACP methyl ester carboxylesterase
MLRIAFRVLAIIAVFVAGAALFVADRQMPRDEMVANYGASPSQFVALPSGANAHYRDWGDKSLPVLVLLPAMNDSLHQWERWAAILSDQYRVVAVDLPGQGLTLSGPDEDYGYESIVAFIDSFTSSLGLERFSLGGNSFGGMMAVHFAIVRPQKVTHLVLVSAAGINNPKSRPPTAMVIAQIPLIREVLRIVPMRPVFAGYLKEMIADDSLVSDALIDRYWNLNRGRATVGLERMSVFARRYAAEDKFIRENLDSIAVPVLVLGGMEDKGSPPSSAEVYATGIPDGRLILYDGVGHFAMLEAPERSANDVRAFFRSH